MQLPTRLIKAEAAMVLSLALFAAPTAATILDCSKIRVDGVGYNLKALGGPHMVYTSEKGSVSYTNTTYSIDICQPLERNDKEGSSQCPMGTRVCAVSRVTSLEDKASVLKDVIPIAGSLEGSSGKPFEYELSRLRRDDPDSEVKQDGLRLTLKGGKYEGVLQRAVIEFLCDKDKEGTEGEWKPEEPKESRRSLPRDEDPQSDPTEGERQLGPEDATLRFERYGMDVKGEWKTLKLTWYTKHVCDSSVGDGDGKDGNDKGDGTGEETGGKSWGFFTWLILLGFMATATYLIFGSWINYTQHGARGWDLLPHGDTIRDIPYLVKDLIRRALNSMQGGGSRGGYSAV